MVAMVDIRYVPLVDSGHAAIVEPHCGHGPDELGGVPASGSFAALQGGRLDLEPDDGSEQFKLAGRAMNGSRIGELGH
jgi:hypothetical protein